MTAARPNPSRIPSRRVDPSMTNFEPLLARLVEELPERHAGARLAAYDRARAALSNHFQSTAHTTTDDVMSESEALEGAIARVEAAHLAEAPPPGPGADPAGLAAAPPPVDERRRFAFNAAAGGMANLAKIGLQLLLLPVMARLLGPAEFGLYALALPTIVFFTTLADGGLGASLARERETSTAVWSTAFWALLASCTLLALVTVGSGFVLAAWSGQPRLPGIMALLSLSFPLLALTALPAARLVRRGNLVVHSIADIVSTLVGATAAIALAMSGAGAWALAVQYVLGWAVSCLVLNAAAFERPTFEFRFAALKTHAATGGSLIGSRLSELIGRQAENLLFGRLFGAAHLGSYTFANQTSRFLCEAAGNPLWGALYSHALREQAGKVATLHRTLSRLLASALFPASALLAVSAPQIFDVVLGRQWAAAAVLVQIVVPFYALSTVAAQCGAILLADGRNAALFWALTGLSAGRVLAFLAAPWAGSVGVAWGIDAANAVYAAAMFAVVGATTGASAWPLMRDLFPPFAASAVAGATCHVLLALRPESLGWTVVCLATGACTFALGLVLLQGRRLMADSSALRRIVLARG